MKTYSIPSSRMMRARVGASASHHSLKRLGERSSWRFVCRINGSNTGKGPRSSMGSFVMRIRGKFGRGGGEPKPSGAKPGNPLGKLGRTSAKVVSRGRRARVAHNRSNCCILMSILTLPNLRIVKKLSILIRNLAAFLHRRHDALSCYKNPYGTASHSADFASLT